MMVGDTCHLALRNLREAAVRTTLTALGVAIGIASLVGMVSFGVALQDQVMGSLLRSGIFDSITVTSAPRVAARNRRGSAAQRLREAIDAARQPTARSRLDDDALKRIAAIGGIREVYPDVRVPVEVSFEQASEFAAASGVPMSARGEGVFQHISVGAFFPNDTDDTCLLSLDFARRMTDRKPEDLVGKSLKLAYASSSGSDQAGAILAPPGVNIQRAERTFRVTAVGQARLHSDAVGRTEVLRPARDT